MKRIILMTAAILISYAALAQQPPKETKAPVVTAELKAQFYKAQLDMERAQKQVQAAQAEFQQMGADFAKVCGEKFQPQVDGNGDPYCAPKPAAPEKPADAPEKK